MDAMSARFACLKVAAEMQADRVGNADKIVEAAKKMAEFVVGPPVKESARSGAAKGADEK